MKIFKYLNTIAQICSDKYGDDFYDALNAAECIVNKVEEEPEKWASRVHAILEGEL